MAFIPVYQHFFSFAGRKSRADVNLARFRPIVLAPLPRHWWIVLDPGFLWDLERDRDIEDTMTLGVQLGKRIRPNLSVAIKPSIQVYGNEDFSWAFQASLSYRFGSTQAGSASPERP